MPALIESSGKKLKLFVENHTELMYARGFVGVSNLIFYSYYFFTVLSM
jgi:hypothetical protein